MKVTRAALPLLPLCQRLLPSRLAGLSLALLKATALELAILAGHLLLYPSGVTQERRGSSSAHAHHFAAERRLEVGRHVRLDMSIRSVRL